MAEVVEPHPPELRLLQQLVEDPMAQIIAVERPAALGAEDPLGHASPAVLEGLLLPGLQQRFQRGGQLGRHVDAPSLAVLRCGDAARNQIASHLRESAVEVDVGPLEGEQFSEPQPGSDGAQEQRIRR